MIFAWYMDGKFKQKEVTTSNQNLIYDALWLDLINPTSEDEALIEQLLNLNIPTREEMQEIEISSRLYKEDDILFMTAPMVAKSQSTSPYQDAVSFVLTPKQLITIRYIEPQVFKLFATIVPKLRITNPACFLTELLDVTIDRFADILEVLAVV